MRTRNTLALGGLLLAAALTLVGCSTPTDSAPADDSGSSSAAGQPAAPVDDPKDLKVAAFLAATDNSYLQVNIQALKDVADDNGFTMDIFTAEWDAQKMYNQVQTALTSGKYNAFIVSALDSNLLCKISAEEAPAAGIVVVAENAPLCGRDTNAGEDTWEPGTLSFIGGQTLDVYQAWVEQVKKDYPDGAKIALIEGPQLAANAKNFDSAADEGFTGEWEVVARQYTDYTTNAAFQATQTILQANPDIDVIMSNYAGMSQGVVQAVDGNPDVAVYDFGGDEWALSSVKNGKLKSTIMMLPYQETYLSGQVLVDLVNGEDVPKFINLTEAPSLEGKSPFVYQDNVDEYKAEY